MLCSRSPPWAFLSVPQDGGRPPHTPHKPYLYVGPQELPIRPSPGNVELTWGGLHFLSEESTKAVTMGNGEGQRQSTGDPAESRLSWPGSRQGPCCFRTLLPEPGEAGPCLLPSGSRKVPASLQSSMFFHVAQLTQVLGLLQPKGHGLPVFLLLCIETVVTQVDRDSVPRAWLGGLSTAGLGTPLSPVCDTGIYSDDHPSMAPNTRRAGTPLHGPQGMPTSLDHPWSQRS